jgi:hypothetical protein
MDTKAKQALGLLTTPFHFVPACLPSHSAASELGAGLMQSFIKSEHMSLVQPGAIAKLYMS